MSNLDLVIRKAIDAYLAVVEVGAVVHGQERVLLRGAATAHRDPFVTDRLAWEIADFLPLAFGRIKMGSLGIKFDECFARLDSSGRLRSYRRLDAEPIFVKSLEIGREFAREGRKELDVISAISIERQMIEPALNRGSLAANLDLGPPILSGPDDLCDPLDQQPTFEAKPWWLDAIRAKTRPWWKFW